MRGSKKLANFDGHLKPGKKAVGRGQFENILTTSFLLKMRTGAQILNLIYKDTSTLTVSSLRIGIMKNANHVDHHCNNHIDGHDDDDIVHNDDEDVDDDDS